MPPHFRGGFFGFTREATFEGQAAMWLEQLARSAPLTEPYPFLFVHSELDFRPLLLAVAQDRARGRDVREIARSFQRGVAQGLWMRSECNLSPSRTGYGCSFWRSLSERLAAGGLEVAANRRSPASVDEPCRSPQRWRDQPGAGSPGGVRLASIRFGSPAKMPSSQAMHELSIAMSIVELAEEEAERRGVQVEAVHLEAGGAFRRCEGGSPLLL